jgi:hypothetical protein
MKTRFLMIVLFLMAASYLASATGTQMDILLEGPWILYPSHIMAPNPQGKLVSTNVLVAVAPFVLDSLGNPLYHKPFINAGDGYVMTGTGVFCLTFNDLCGNKAGNSTAFTPAQGYPAPNPIKVNLPSSIKTWDVFGLADRAYILILPMPDSYSNDGAWYMEFSNDFISYSNSQAVSIGVTLHYVQGPSTVDLKGCSAFNAASSCVTPISVVQTHRHTRLPNTGLLRITMKVPKEDNQYDDACDYHVRSVYHPTLYLIDNQNPFASKNNANQQYGFVDPAVGTDATVSGAGTVFTPVFDPSCFAKDDQQKDKPSPPQVGQAKQPKAVMHVMSADVAENSFASTFTENLNKAAALINDPDLVERIRKDSAFFNSPKDFPTLLQLDRLAFELNEAAKMVGATQQKDSAEIASYLQTQASAIDDAKNGADCRSPMMLLPPQP